MRLTTDFWIAALMRRVFGDGGFAAVVRRGAAEAGAAFVVVRGRTGRVSLFGPAAQASYDTARPDERQFTEMVADGEMEQVDALLAKEARFDPDFWVVEVEPGATEVKDLLSVTMP
ncbi:MAG: DUF1491 family protein [Rhizobiaceae bacterium]|nr:DUF1491 family protein [Rhizobiaceae bacterium]